jgi:hypothetical protein
VCGLYLTVRISLQVSCDESGEIVVWTRNIDDDSCTAQRAPPLSALTELRSSLDGTGANAGAASSAQRGLKARFHTGLGKLKAKAREAVVVRQAVVME